MTEENVTPPAPANYSNNEEIKVHAGEGMELPPEPSKSDETKGQGEETPTKNENAAPDNQPKKVDEAGAKSEHSSKIIASLGEDRKNLAKELIDLARTDKTAASKVKALAENDERIANLIKTKFGDDYDRLMKGEDLGKTTETQTVDVEKIKREAYVEARAEAIMKDAEAAKVKQLNVFAESHGLNADEAEAVKEYAETLEGKTVGGRKFDFESALGAALNIVSKDKANASTSESPIPSGEKNAQPAKDEVQVTDDLKTYTNRIFGSSRKPEDVAKGLAKVSKGLQPDGSYKLSL